MAVNEGAKAKPKRKGFFAVLRESMTKTSEGCGPGCGCHTEGDRGKAKAGEAIKDGKDGVDR